LPGSTAGAAGFDGISFRPRLKSFELQAVCSPQRDSLDGSHRSSNRQMKAPTG